MGSLFAGVEGFGQGFEAAGFEVAWQVEIDNDAVSVLERHYPNTQRHRDVRLVSGHTIAPVDVMIGGFPCQDLSVAGKQAGLGGSRSGLFWEVVRIVGEMREATAQRYPGVVVLENVPGLLSSNRGRDFLSVLRGLAGLGAAVAWRIFDAQFFGVPQRRRRVFIVADFAPLDIGERRAIEILSLFEGMCRHPQTSDEARQGAPGVSQNGAGDGGVACDIADTLSVGANQTTGFVGDDVAHGLQASYGNGSPRGDGADNLVVRSIAGTLNAGAHPGSYNGQDATSGLLIAAPLTAGGHPDSNAPGRHREDDENLVVAAWDERNVTSAAIRSRCEPGLPANTLHADGLAVAFNWQAGGGGNDQSFRGKSRQYIERAGDYAGALSATRVDAVAFTNRGTANDDTHETLRAASHGALPMTSQGAAVRRLTPQECEALQGWPRDWTRYRADGSEIADGPRYRMIGNGVVASVSEWIGRRLLAALTTLPVSAGEVVGR